MPEELTAEQAAARLDHRRHAGYPARPRPAARVPARARRARGLDRSARLRRAARGRCTELFSRAGRALPVRVLRPARAGAAGRRRRHRVHARRLPALRSAARAAGTARDDDRRNAARCRRLVLAVAARGRHDRRVAPRGRRSRSAARRRGLRRLPADVRAGRAASPRAARRRDRHPGALDRRAARAARGRRAAHRRRQGDRAARRRLHPVRRDPAGGDRLDSQPDRDAAGRG